MTATHEDIRWAIDDEDHLARLVAVVALGQAQHAANLIALLEPVSPAFSTDDLRAAAVASMEIRHGTDSEMLVRRWQRDGLIFEVLSWIALIQQHVGDEYLIRDPHLGSTTQGLDGLLLEVDLASHAVVRTVILEDKCSEKPRRTFKSLVMPAFTGHHNNVRAPDLVAAAANLLGRLGDKTQAVKSAASVLDLRQRGYRASLAIETSFDESPKRQNLFKGYDDLGGIPAERREGSGFVVGEQLRPWFEQFSQRVCSAIQETEADDFV